MPLGDPTPLLLLDIRFARCTLLALSVLAWDRCSGEASAPPSLPAEDALAPDSSRGRPPDDEDKGRSSFCTVPPLGCYPGDAIVLARWIESGAAEELLLDWCFRSSAAAEAEYTSSDTRSPCAATEVPP